VEGAELPKTVLRFNLEERGVVSIGYHFNPVVNEVSRTILH